MRSLFLSISSFLLLISTASVGFAQMAPIYLKPGQCILIGGQQVCAMMGDKIGADGSVQDPPKPLTMKVCKWGAADDAHEGVKGYGVYQVVVKDDGSKTETLLKSYGPVDQAGCEKEAQRKE